MPVLDIRQFVERLRLGWRTPLLLVGIAVVYTLLTLPLQKPTYRVTMLVVPAPNEQSTTTGTGGLSALLSFAGNTQSSSNYTRYQKLLVSPVVAEAMDKKYGMIRYVFASYWDKERRIWVAPNTLRGFLLGWLFQLSHVPAWSPPDATSLATYLEDNLLIVPAVRNDILTISMTNSDVAFAKKVMLAAHEQANIVLRDQVARRAHQQVLYLQEKLTQTTISDYRQTLLQILSTQEKNLMLTQTNASFAAEILDPPVASQIPVAPRPILSMFVAVLAGGLVGSIIVVFCGPDWWQRSRRIVADWRSARRPKSR
jgi:uncharacterized protein involved in exopolysaccharide biosynthesis